MKSGYLSVFLIALLVFSCKKKVKDPAPDIGYDYAPVTIGKYVVYDVDSTVYDDVTMTSVNYKYRIKEKLEDNVIDNEGRQAIRLVRYMKRFNASIPYENMQWVIKDVWNYTKTKSALEVVEENIRYTKLSFPIKLETKWNGNAYNMIGEWLFTYIYINQAESFNGTNFDDVLMVEQKDDKNKNAIHRQYYIEKYAKGVGLVHKEIKDVYSNNVIAGIPVEQRIEKGVIYKLSYVTHGME